MRAGPVDRESSRADRGTARRPAPRGTVTLGGPGGPPVPADRIRAAPPAEKRRALNATRPPLSPFEWLRGALTSTEPVFGVSRSVLHRLVLVVVATLGGRAMLQGVEAATAWLPGRSALVRALEPVATDADLKACASAECTLATLRPRRIADGPGLNAWVPARLAPGPSIRITFDGALPLGRYGLDHPVSWAAQARFVDGVARWSLDLQYMGPIGGWRDLERPPPGSGLRGRVEIALDGPGIVERYLPVSADRPPLEPAGLARLATPEQDAAAADERFAGFDFRPLPNPVPVRVDAGRDDGLSEGDPVRLRAGGADPQAPGFDGRVERVARAPDGSVTAHVRVDDTQMQRVPETVARGLQDLGARRAEWPVSLEVDRRFGNAAAGRFWVPSAALVRRTAGGDPRDATLWVLIDGFAVPGAVAVIAERDGESAVVERRFAGTTALRPDDWRALTPMQRARLLRRTVGAATAALVGEDAQVVARPSPALRPGARARAA